MTLANASLLLIAGLWAGAQNAVAGGGSFITIPALMFAGLDARAANVTSSVALYPGQMTTGLAGRSLIESAPMLSFKAMCIIGAIGGLIGAILLLMTPGATFEAMLPWLVLFATCMFAWSAFGRKQGAVRKPISHTAAVLMQGIISVYGGYFGGGIGFMMVASLSLMGLSTRPASATKNMLAGVINTTSLLVFLFSPSLIWIPALLLAAGAVAGGLVGARLLKRVPERALRIAIVLIGAILTVGLFLQHHFAR